MRRITLVSALALAAFLTAPATSLGGGFATVGLSSLPDGAGPGEAWVVDLTVLQHGRTPLDGVEPAMIIEPARRGTATRFDASPTGQPGVYRARVVFPSAGEWTYAADDGFAATHQMGTVRIGGDPAATAAATATAAKSPPPASPDGGMSLLGALAVAALAGLLAALLAEPVRKRLASRAAEA